MVFLVYFVVRTPAGPETADLHLFAFSPLLASAGQKTVQNTSIYRVFYNIYLLWNFMKIYKIQNITYFHMPEHDFT